MITYKLPVNKYMTFKNAFTGFNNDYNAFKEFVSNPDNADFFKSGLVTVNRIQFRIALDMSQTEIMAYFKTWSLENKPKKTKKAV